MMKRKCLKNEVVRLMRENCDLTDALKRANIGRVAAEANESISRHRLSEMIAARGELIEKLDAAEQENAELSKRVAALTEIKTALLRFLVDLLDRSDEAGKGPEAKHPSHSQ